MIWKKSRARGLRICQATGEYYIHAKVNGRAVSPSATGTTVESQAILIRDARMKAMVNVTPEAAAGLKVSVAELAASYERNVGLLELKPNARLFRKELLGVFRKTWPDLNMEAAKITPQSLRDWAGKVSHYSPGRFNSLLDTARHILDLAVEVDALRRNPLQRVAGVMPLVRKRRVPKSRYGRDELMTDEEFWEIVKWIRANGYGRNGYGANLIIFLRYTGLRINEAARLEKSHLDVFTEPSKGIYGWINIPGAITKNDEPRPIPIFEQTYTVITQWLKVCRKKKRSFRVGDQWETLEAEWLSPSDDCYRVLRKACRALKIKVKVSHHTFRHLFATTCFELGLEDVAVGALLGHQDGGALARRTYTHAREGFVNREAEKMASGLAKPGNVIDLNSVAA